MANRRMFNISVVDTDIFLEMPLSTQALYFHLSMRADDDGFIGNVKKIQRMIGASEDDLKILIAKQFLLTFETGIIVIKHWRLHNCIRKDRVNPTIYQEEKNMLNQDKNKIYYISNDINGTQSEATGQQNDNHLAGISQPSVNQKTTKCPLSIGKVSIDKPSQKRKSIKEKSNKLEQCINEDSGFGSSNPSPSQPEIQPLTVGEFNNLTISEQELAELVQTYSREVVDRYINQVSNSLQRGTLKNVNSTYAIVKTFIQNDINNGRLTSPKKIHLGRAPTMPRVCPKCKRELDAAGRCLNCKIAAEFDKSKNQWVWIKLAPSHAVVDDWIRKKRGFS